MSLITWSESYSLGVESIDRQHRVLIDLLNELHTAMTAGVANDCIDKVLDRLVKYTTSHFTFEERLMSNAGYPKYLAHKAEHEKLTAEVLDFQKRFRSGRIGVSIEVLRFLRDWLTHHINGRDRDVAQHLIRSGEVS